MAPIQVLLFLALSLSINALVLFKPLTTFSDQNPNNSLPFIAVQIFLLLVPLTFISALILLFLHVAVPHSALFIKRLITAATRVLVSSILFLGTPLVAHMAFTEAVLPNTIAVMFIGTAVTAAAVAYKLNPFRRYFNSAGQTVRSFVPVFVALCISTGTFWYIDPLFSFPGQKHEGASVSIPIQLLLALNFFNFILAMALLFIHIVGPAEGSQVTFINNNKDFNLK